MIATDIFNPFKAKETVIKLLFDLYWPITILGPLFKMRVINRRHPV
jgi:hypothetical protein